MNSRSRKLFCGIIASLFICIGFKASCIEYSEILDSMDILVSNVFDKQNRLLTEDHIDIAKAYWAMEIIEIMTEQKLVIHWMDHVQADPQLVLQIFNRSHDNAIQKHPLFREYLQEIEILRSMGYVLGLQI